MVATSLGEAHLIASDKERSCVVVGWFVAKTSSVQMKDAGVELIFKE